MQEVDFSALSLKSLERKLFITQKKHNQDMRNINETFFPAKIHPVVNIHQRRKKEH